MHNSKGFDWVRASALAHPTDTASPVYPDRPIRPLPKQRIRSRLSIEEADLIQFPPIPPSSSPLFGSPNNRNDRGYINNHYAGNGDALQDEQDLDHICDCGGHHSGIDSDEEEEIQDRSAHRNSWPGRMIRYPRAYGDPPVARTKALPIHSTTSSADGYESFENTNNKKKRKIPIHGASGSLSLDGSSMGIPTQSVDVSVSQDGRLSNHHYLNSGSGVGIAGAGRGRNSKSVNRALAERRPLAATSNASNVASRGTSTNSQGIIGAAIANAAGTKSSATGQENISLLQRQSHGSSVPKDFTFEWPSDSANKMSFAAHNAVSPPLTHSSAPPNANRNMHTQGPHNGTQTTPNPNSASYPQSQQPLPPPKPRRRRHDSLREAAESRRARQAQENINNPPNSEDRWLCEFCEFEAIFGRPPVALIRQYEKRDQLARKRAEAQRRNLEKVKAKGRKNRKGAKGVPKNNNVGANADMLPPQNEPYDPRYDAGIGDLDSQGEEYFDDGYEDPVPLPIPQPQRQPATQRYAPPPPPPPPDDYLEEHRPMHRRAGSI